MENYNAFYSWYNAFNQQLLAVMFVYSIQEKALEKYIL